jgi:hypothetical protein
MAFLRTMGTVVGQCQRRADKEPDGHVDTDEWKELIAEHYGELHAAVVGTGARVFEAEADITANGAASYPLPAAHYSTVGVDLVVDAAGARRDLDELMVQERTLFAGATGTALYWSFTGTSIALYPKPSSGTYKHLYVPQPTDYSTVGNGTEIDFLCIFGLKFVVWGVASVVLHKGDDNQLRAIDERDRAMAKLVEWGVLRALTQPKRRQVNGDDIQRLSPADWRLTRP